MESVLETQPNLLKGSEAIEEIKKFAKNRQNKQSQDIMPVKSDNDPYASPSKKNVKFAPWMWALRCGVNFKADFDAYVDLSDKYAATSFWEHIVAKPEFKNHKWDATLEKHKIEILDHGFNYDEVTKSFWEAFLKSDYMCKLIENGFFHLFVKVKNLSTAHKVNIEKSLEEAYEMIMKADKAAFKRHLLQLDLKNYIAFVNVFSPSQYKELINLKGITIRDIAKIETSDEDLWQLFQNALDNNSCDECISYIQANGQLKNVLSKSFVKMGAVFDKLMEVKFFTVSFFDRCYSILRYLPPLCFFISNRVQDGLSTKLDCLYRMFKRDFLFEFFSLFFAASIHSSRMYVFEKFTTLDIHIPFSSTCFASKIDFWKPFRRSGENENVSKTCGFFSP